MGEQLDYATLKWIKDEIQESLNQTQQALEAFIEDPGDTTQIRFCAAYLHQVLGTLQMVEIYGAALLAEEMEKVANALLNEKISQKDDAFDVLIRAIIQLPAYLEGLERGQADMPIVLTPLLNDLRAARGEPLLSESAFFSPDINVSPPEKRLSPDKEYPDIQIYARKLRPIYQVALLGWFRNENIAGSLKKLCAVLSELQNASTTDTMQRLWWVSGGISEALLDDGLETSVSVKMLMGQVDREIKKLIDNGEDSAVTDSPAELLKNCLYYVGLSKSSGPRVSALKQAFELDKILPYSGDIDQAMDNLKGSTEDIMENVSSVIKEDLLNVKDQLDIFVRNPERNPDDLVTLGEVLNRTADTLAMLNLADLRKVIQSQATNIEQLVAGSGDPDDKALMEIASALLYVESSLDTLKESNREHAESEAPDLAVHEEDGNEGSVVLLPPSEQAQITNMVIKEARDVLADVKEGFNTFAIESDRFDVIAESPAKLVQIQGALAVMNFDRAANLIGAAVAYIRNDMMAEQGSIDASKLDILADAITSVEYYLEAIEEGRGQPENVLAVAEISVEQLGYPVSGEYAISDTAAVVGTNEESLFESENEGEIEFDFSEEPELLAEDERVVDDVSVAIEEPVVDIDIGAALLAEEPDEEYLSEDIDEEILEIFIEEADEVIGTMIDCLHAWRADNNDKKSLETLRRSYHTLKGSGRLAGAMVMGEFAWAMENMLNRVMEDKVEVGPSMFKLMDQAEATLKKLLAHLKGETDQRPPIKRLSNIANAFAEGEEFSVSDVLPVAAAGAAKEAPEPSADVAATEITLEEPELVELEPIETEGPESVEPQESEVMELELDDSMEASDISFESLDEPIVDEVDSTSPEISEVENIEESTVEVAPSFDPVLAQVFRKETVTHLAALNEYLSEFGEVDAAPVNDALHRALHTLHGSARMAGVFSIAGLAEPMDRLVRAMHEREMTLDADGTALLKNFTVAIEALADNFDSEQPGETDFSDILARIDSLREQVLATPVPVSEDGEMQGFAATVSEGGEEDAEIIAIFLEEASDILANIDEFMQQWNAAVDDLDIVAELQRALHTIKGGARLAGLMPVGDLMHELETALESVTEGGRQVTKELPALVQSGLDWLLQSVESIKAGNVVEPAVEILRQIEEFQSSEASNEELNADDLLDLDGLEITSPSDFAEDLSPTEVIELDEPLVFEEALKEEPVEEFEELEDIAEIQAPPIEKIPEPVAAAVDYDPDLLEVFLEEADEIQEETERVLYEWSGDFENIEHIANMQRSLHTLKGGARMANVTAVGDLAHAMESLLERVADGRMPAAPDHPDLMQTCHDWMVRALDEAKKLQPIIPATELVAQIEAVISGKKYVPAEPVELEAAQEFESVDGALEADALQQK
jgi:chemosensory pili system protein ChpA (sensor histidine kinase/response regulator)